MIRNGFDRAHNLPTSYEDFRQYLLDEYPDSDADNFTIPEGQITADGDMSYEDVDVDRYILLLQKKGMGHILANIYKVMPNIEPTASKKYIHWNG
ncbi:hypothetical protein QD46_07675 [Paenibacillus polymyxa]|nr:hypothetical protein QD46_07675 [Paenibacillus polymyxa]